jgi:hypothetical protein
VNQTPSRRIGSTPLTLAQVGYTLLLVVLVGLIVIGLPAFKAEQDRGYINTTLEQDAQGNIVLTPYENGEAAQAGIQTGDVLTKINDTPLQAGTSVDTAIELLRGKVGEEVKLAVRNSSGSEKTVSIVRSQRYIDTLAGLGLKPVTYTGLYIAIEVILTVVMIAASLWIFLKHRKDWLALLAAAILVVLPSGMGVVNFPPAGADKAGLNILYQLFRSLALGLGVLLLLVFPNGVFFPGWTKSLAIVVASYMVLFWVYMILPNHFLPFYLETWLWLVIFLIGVYAQARRYLQFSTAGEKKQTRWLLAGVVAVIVAYLLVFIYNQLPYDFFIWSQWLVFDLVRNGIMAAALIYFAFCLIRAKKKVE